MIKQSVFLLIFLSGCETIIYWQNLPPPNSNVKVYISPQDIEEMKRLLPITQRLVSAYPLPVERIFVYSTFYAREKLKWSSINRDRAAATRCGKGEQPPLWGCIFIPYETISRFSDDTHAAIIAHELGHIEKGHRSWEGVAEPTLIQWEADESALNRLYLAGYCAGATIRKAGNEEALLYGPGRARHPCKTIQQTASQNDEEA